MLHIHIKDQSLQNCGNSFPIFIAMVLFAIKLGIQDKQKYYIIYIYIYIYIQTFYRVDLFILIRKNLCSYHNFCNFQVKLKCVESHTASPSSVSLFLVEPKTCEYVLGVESPLICDILEYADENGLLSEKFDVNFDKLKTTAFHEYDDLDERIANGDD